MRPRAGSLAAVLHHRGVRDVPLTAQLFRAGERIFAGGGGLLLEIDVERRPEDWESRAIPAGLFARDPDEAWPLLLGPGGEVYRLESDLSLREIHRVAPASGGAGVFALSDGSVLVCTVNPAPFGTYLLDPEGTIGWHVTAADPVLAAFEEVVFAVASGEPHVIICRETSNGKERWRRRGRLGDPAMLVAVVDDIAWISDQTALAAVHLADGKEYGRIDPGVLASVPRLRPDGRAHLVFGGAQHWMLDLRAGAVESRRKFSDGPLADLYPMEPLTGDALLVRDRSAALYTLTSGNGESAWPAPLWRAPALPMTAVVHREGLIVLTEPSRKRRAPPMRGVHWLAPPGVF